MNEITIKVVCLTALLLMLCEHVSADQITLINGDRVTGKIVKSDGAPSSNRLELFEITDPKEEYPQTGLQSSWIAGPAIKVIVDFEQSLKKYPPIPPGTPDPYTPRM
jgi:hypothetical protein